MSQNKISVIIFGSEESLMKALTTIILGKDLSFLKCKRPCPRNTAVYANDTFEVMCTSDVDTKFDYKYPSHDMRLVIVEDGYSADDVCQQLENLSSKTGQGTEAFKVVLPLGQKLDHYPSNFCTIEQILCGLAKLATERGSTSRPAGYPDSKNQMRNWSGRYDEVPFKEQKKVLKRKHTIFRVNLVLLGMAGTGKSASGNTILGGNWFMSKPSSMPVTTECQVAEIEINGINVHVIDTPDIFDDDRESSVHEKHVKKCKELCESRPCVYVLVMHVSRFTDGERGILKKLEKAFGNKVTEQMIILFTRGDDLLQGGMSLKDFLHSCQPGLMEIIKKCGNRCVVFENRRPGLGQVGKLMESVRSFFEVGRSDNSMY